MLVGAGRNLSHEDGPNVPLIDGVQDDRASSLDALSGALGQVIGSEGGALESVAVLKGDLELKIQVIHLVDLRANLKGCLPHPEGHLFRPPLV